MQFSMCCLYIKLNLRSGREQNFRAKLASVIGQFLSLHPDVFCQAF